MPRRFLDDFFQRQVFELGTLDQVVQVGDIRLVVLTVVVFQRFLRDGRARASMAYGSGGRVCSIVVPLMWVLKMSKRPPL
jgi:hypothetical protein